MSRQQERVGKVDTVKTIRVLCHELRADPSKQADIMQYFKRNCAEVLATQARATLLINVAKLASALPDHQEAFCNVLDENFSDIFAQGPVSIVKEAKKMKAALPTQQNALVNLFFGKHFSVFMESIKRYSRARSFNEMAQLFPDFKRQSFRAFILHYDDIVVGESDRIKLLNREEVTDYYTEASFASALALPEAELKQIYAKKSLSTIQKSMMLLGKINTQRGGTPDRAVVECSSAMLAEKGGMKVSGAIAEIGLGH